MSSYSWICSREDSTNYGANIFMDILHSANMKQHVFGPTHQKGHTLDLIIACESDDFLCVSDIVTTGYLPSDRVAIAVATNIIGCC